MGLKAAIRRRIDALVLAVRVVTGFSSRQLARYAWYKFRPDPRIGDAIRSVKVREYRDTGGLQPDYWRSQELSNDLTEAAFLNLRGTLTFPDSWQDGSMPRLWTYKLHYFDDLRASASVEHKRRVGSLLDRWIADNPPSLGVGWEPYPLSIRLSNICQWLIAEPGEQSTRRLESVALQARYLEKSLEYHVGGNHLWTNAKALIAAGVLLAGPYPARWLSKGTDLLQQCIRSQLYADGAHAELSPMYQALLLEELLDVFELARSTDQVINRTAIEEITQAIRQMAAWLEFMCHPDGRIAFFNDANFDIAPPPQLLRRRIQDCGLADQPGYQWSSAHIAGGFSRLQRGEWLILADTAQAGMRRTPGHIHADSLSFELSLGAERVIVNRGISTYEPTNRRLLERSTRSHSTVEVDGRSSTQITRSFRTGRTARIQYRGITSGSDHSEATASHDGFRLVGIGPNHLRTWRLSDQGLLLTDEIQEGDHHRCRSRLHLAPGLECISWSDGLGRFRTPAGRVVVIRVAGPASTLKRGYYHPAFHTTIRNQYIEALFRGSRMVKISINTE